MAIELKEIEARAGEGDFREIQDRMDKDMDLYFMKDYVMLDFKNQPIPKIVNLTLNDPATYAFRSIAILQAASPQVVVESKKLTDAQTTYIEDFAEDLLLTIDQNLGLIGLWGLYPFICEQECVRGRLSAQVLNRLSKDKKSVVIDVRPLDTRYEVYDMGMEGLNYHCKIANITKTELKEKHNKDLPEGTYSELIWDIYDRGKNYFYLGQGESAELVNEQKTPYNYVPIVTQKVPAGSMLAHPDAISHDGESIFALNRKLYPELNRLGTVLHNLNMATFFGAKQYASEAGEGKETEALPFGLGVVVSIEKGAGYTLIPVNDIKNATRLLYSMIETRLQRGSFSALDYGNLTFPLSGAAIARVTEGRDQIFVPRLQASALFYQQLLRMCIKQIIAIGKTVELGEEGHRREYDPKQLAGEYTIQFQYFSESKEQKLANITEAQALQGIMPLDYIIREVIHAKDPDAILDQLDYEEAAKLDPALRLYQRCHSLADREKYMEAEMTLRTLEFILKQQGMQMGATMPTPQGETQARKSPMPLLGAGGGGGERRLKTEEEGMAEEGEEGERQARLAETGRAGRATEQLVGR